MSTFTLEIPDHLSRSQVDTYSNCGRKWLLQRGLRVPQRPGWATIGGSAVHAVTEMFDREMMKGVVMDDDLLREAFLLEFESETKDHEETYQLHRSEFRASGRASKKWPNKENEDWWKERGPEFVLSWKSWRRVTPWDLVQLVNKTTGEMFDPIEYRYELTLDEGLVTHGAIDRIFTYQNQLIVVDLKTGSYEPKGADQLADYATAIEEAVGERPRWGYYWMARDGGVTGAADLSDPTLSREEMVKTYSMTKRGIEAGVFLPNRSNLCSSCTVRDFCKAVGGERSSEVEV